MKEQYIEEIMQYVYAQDDQAVKWLAEMSHFVDKAKLSYIFTFVTKLFGSR